MAIFAETAENASRERVFDW